MSGNAALWNTLWGEWIVEELIRCGLKLFCISPGSRSTPLTVAAARHPEAEINLIYDERAAAYYALGYSRGSETPGVLIALPEQQPPITCQQSLKLPWNRFQ